VEVLQTIQRRKKGGKKKKTNRGRVKNVNRRGLRSILGGAHLSWASVMNDPFNNPPINLRMGTMVPTSLFTFYFRGQLTSNSTDGSFAIAVVASPKVTSSAPIGINTAGAGVATWGSHTSFTNVATADTVFGSNYEFRPIAGGLRVIPSIAATSAPGQLYAGAVPTAAQNAVEAFTPSGFSSSPFAECGNAMDGASVTMRPQDLNSFTFKISSNQAVSNIPTWSTPVIAGIGLPNSTVVFYEAILHCEVIASVTALSEGDEESKKDKADLITNYGSLEGMYARADLLLKQASSLTSRFTDAVSTMTTVGGAVSGLYHRMAHPRPGTLLTD